MKVMKYLRLAAIVTMLGLTVGVLSGCSTQTETSGKFTWWIPEGEDAVYYQGYNENPVVQYLQAMTFGEKNEKIELDFVVPPSGTAQENITTAVSTGEYQDIIDTATIVNTMSVLELYDAGIALDLTEYVNQYMPNYRAYLEANPELQKTATNLVDGEVKYLQLWSYQDAIQMWGGWNYRRDWIVKYGQFPSGHENEGEAFAGGYDADGIWQDDVIFPSWYSNDMDWYKTVHPDWDGSDPVTISDWEWMLEIFQSAIESEEITGGYPMSLYYPGYYETGDLATSFGGGGTVWYIDEAGNVQFGMTDDGFRTYLECVSHWYAQGWIDKSFSDKSKVMFYEIDNDKVYQGKVGLWFGMISALNDGLCSDEDGTINVWGARQPINDKYGGENVKFKEPTVMYQVTPEMRSVVITDKAKDKNLELLFTVLDYMYTDEFSKMAIFGLTGEQNAVINSPLLEKLGIAKIGSYVEYQTDDGVRYGVPTKNDAGEDVFISLTDSDAMRGSKLIGVACNSLKFFTDPIVVTHGMSEYSYYKLTGGIVDSLIGQMDADDAKDLSSIKLDVREFGAKYVPDFVKGSKDATDDSDWEKFVAALNKKNPDSGTTMLKTLLDMFGE